MNKKSKKGASEDSHPIFKSCVWRFGSSTEAFEEKLRKCASCYQGLEMTTAYCESMKRCWDGSNEKCKANSGYERETVERMESA